MNITYRKQNRRIEKHGTGIISIIVAAIGCMLVIGGAYGAVVIAGRLLGVEP